ncbi:MAG TPA: ATP synthase subunit I [Burkholderiales bacterium]|nr:ATP synthase subunit I [Burkholderiales bacterium]
MLWQVAATAVMAAIGWSLSGAHGAVSGAAGGTISICAGLAAAWVAARKVGSAGGVLVGALTAEAVKIGLAALLLWLVLANYADAVVGAVLASFIVTMLIFGMAFFVRDY